MEECLQTSSVSHVISKIITKHQKVGELEQRGQVHLLTRGVGRRQLFETEADYDGF